jgi:hypothetical protein
LRLVSRTSASTTSQSTCLRTQGDTPHIAAHNTPAAAAAGSAAQHLRYRYPRGPARMHACMHSVQHSCWCRAVHQGESPCQHTRADACLARHTPQNSVLPPQHSNNTPVDLRPALVAHKAVLLAVVEPVARPACDVEAPQAVGLDPDQLVHTFVAPLVQQLTTQLQRTACKCAQPATNAWAVVSKIRSYSEFALLSLIGPPTPRNSAPKAAVWLEWALASSRLSTPGPSFALACRSV